VPIPGKHNSQNTLAAIVMSRGIGLSEDSILKTLGKFKGVEHRCEFVVESKRGVRWYNDSKATNVDSLEKALLSFDAPIVLVAGGRDKQSAYDRLNSLTREKVKGLVLLGEAAPLLEKAWGTLAPSKTVKTMEEAVKEADAMAEQGDIVLLSPACTSFDMFKDYEDRGRAFKRSIRDHLNL